jgi:hypothetical protein
MEEKKRERKKERKKERRKEGNKKDIIVTAHAETIYVEVVLGSVLLSSVDMK